MRTKDSSGVILDGTGEQFGWFHSNAIFNGGHFWHLYTSDENHEESGDLW
jgi:hypothetical protein